ncbi:hypothetical protein E4U35_004145 [Claviceps purpurea]|nr:hypothetical protein E4U35_004145 [Claviceps purpurea]
MNIARQRLRPLNSRSSVQVPEDSSRRPGNIGNERRSNLIGQVRHDSYGRHINRLRHTVTHQSDQQQQSRTRADSSDNPDVLSDVHTRPLRRLLKHWLCASEEPQQHARPGQRPQGQQWPHQPNQYHQQTQHWGPPQKQPYIPWLPQPDQHFPQPPPSQPDVLALTMNTIAN